MKTTEVKLISDHRARTAAVLASCIGLAGGILAFDLSMPLGVAGGVPYIVPVLVGMWLPWRCAPFALAVVCTFLTFYGYFHSPSGGIPWVVLTNRALAIFAIWVTAILMFYARKSERALYEATLSNRAKDEFLARFSHELRTPLNAVLGFSEIIKKQIFGPVGAPCYLEYANDIHHSGLHLLDLINDLLDLSKITAGKLELSECEISLAEFAPEMVRLFEPNARKKEIDLTLDVEPCLPLVRADTRAVKQMILNLLSNAIKFTPEGGRVVVHARSCDDGVLISIEDSGIGIDPEDINKVLSPFGQVKSATIGVEGGTGLGLPIVKSLIELHGGRFDIQSSPGVGTTVALHFPLRRVVQVAA